MQNGRGGFERAVSTEREVFAAPQNAMAHLQRAQQANSQLAKNVGSPSDEAHASKISICEIGAHS
jgi:hypothetical protein